MSARSQIVMCVALAVLVMVQTPLAAQRQAPLPRELAWIGLFDSELVAWLENENRLEELCGAPGSAQADECRVTHMTPKAMLIVVRAEPRLAAKPLGQIVLVAVPGRGLTSFVSAGRTTQAFTPDLFDTDWGYGPYFHQTILARSNYWLRVPLPVIGAGWINAEEWSERDELARENPLIRVETVTAGQILTTPRGDMFVLGTVDGVLRVRPEQDADLWCEAGDAPALKAFEEIRIPFEQLFDAGGHLQISYKYKRGC